MADIYTLGGKQYEYTYGPGGMKYRKEVGTTNVEQTAGLTLGKKTLARAPVYTSTVSLNRNLAADFGSLTTKIQAAAAAKIGKVPLPKTGGGGGTAGSNLLSQAGGVSYAPGASNMISFGLGPGGPMPGAPGGIPGIQTGIPSIDQLLGAGWDWLLGQLSGGQGPGTGGAGGSLTGATANQCPTGYTWNGSQCVTAGLTGTVQRFLPGGATGTLADAYGEAVLGRYGVALQPAQVGQVTSLKTGITNPILRCPPGMKLGKDNLCYKSLTKKERKWVPQRKPLLTGGDMNALARVKRIRTSLRKAAGAADLTCKKR